MKLFKSEKGQALILFALFLPVLCGFMGLAVDLGWIFYNQSKLQDASDFALLSAGHDIPENYYKDDVIKTSFDCNAHNSLNPSTTNDKETALKYFCKNYPSDSVESITLGKSVKVPGQDFYGIKATVADQIPLYFMQLFGMNNTTIKAKSTVVIEKLAKPKSVIPIGFDVTEMQNVLDGLDQTNLGACDPPDITKTPREILIWSEDGTSQKGNFGILDLTGGFSGSELPDQIEYGLPSSAYPSVSPPLVGDKIDTKTGSMAKHVGEGFQQRIARGNQETYLPIVDMSKATGSSVKLEVLGYTKVTGLRAINTFVSNPSNYRTCVYATFQERVEPRDAGYFEMKTVYYGVKRVLLVDDNTYTYK